MDTNAQQRIPPLFKEIMRNDAEREALRKQEVLDFYEFKALREERVMYRMKAEEALRWNTNKGNAGG